ncbi:MAG TPA: ferrous iron transporter B [Candidatus Limnocylindrales bacterium]|nr:ferrous iron transporter B [Candidatus Limnocylindrales bacterium]
MKIALAGNPNSGKTTLFNAITGKMEYVGNWPGVTVAKKVAKLKNAYTALPQKNHLGPTSKGKDDDQISVVDLPGAYSMTPYTGEEAITSDFVRGENPDVIINIIDSSSLERSLFFTTQLLELDIPLVIALNKQDIMKRYGDKIDLAGLSDALRCEIVEIIATEGVGLKKLLSKAIAAAALKTQAPPVFEGKGTEGENRGRQSYIKTVVSTHLIKKRISSEITFSDRVDRVVANAYLGLPLFALIMWAVYAFSIGGVGGWASGYINDTLFGEIIPNAAANFLEGIGVHSLLQALIIEAAIGGVGAVLGFLPLIMVLFFCLGLLEDSGYMARVAVVMDRYFKRIGLSGKSIIPMIVGTGCSIPGVMAARTIEDDNERIATTMLTPFVPCGAKLPIIALMAAVFFPGATWVFPSMYVIAGSLIIVGGLLLRKIYKFKSVSAFILELPEYKIPSMKHAFKLMFKQTKVFLVRAATIILVMNTVVWFMQTYDWNLQIAENQSASVLASVGGIIAPLLIPLGFIGWQAAAATLTGFIAKENVVATFAIILAASDEALHVAGSPLSELFTPITAFSFLVFNLFIPPCFAAIGAMNAELHDRKWLFRAIFFQLGVGYTMAMLTTQIGTLLIYGKPASGFVPASILAVLIAGLLYCLIHRNDKTTIKAGLAVRKE